jgi:FkbM family methyltransferase
MFKKGKFVSKEYEYHILHEWIRPGDWVIDIGANFGVYTARFSELVGPTGRVISIEPVQQTFDVLNAVVQDLPIRNVTLLNVAGFSESCAIPLSIPQDQSGWENLYESSLDRSASGPIALCISVDALQLPNRVALVKIDTEGAELNVLRGMRSTLAKDHPILIVEWMKGMEEIVEFLEGFGYRPVIKSKKGVQPDGFDWHNYVFRADSND